MLFRSDVRGFIEKDTDILDCAFVTLLRNSSDPFIAKLMAGPSLATERHSKDENIIVQAQVSSRPLRSPTTVVTRDGSTVSPSEEHSRLDPSKVYPITTQLNYTLSEIMWNLDRTRLWTVSCIRPNDSGTANSFDKRRVKAQIRALLLPDLVARRKHDFVVDFEQAAFCDRYVPTMGGSEAERIRQCASSNGWKEGEDYVVGHRMIWLTYPAWKVVEDVLRASEKDHKRGGTEVGDDESVLPDDATEYTHQESLTPGAYYGGGESEDNLLLTRTGTHGTQYRDPAFPTPHTPSNPETPAYSDAEGWGSEWDKKGGSATPPDAGMSKEGDLVAKAPNTVEEVPTSRSRRNWLYVVKATTWWIPAVALSKLGRMKRPDIQLAWREKVTIFWLIFLFNCIVIFYIIEFGRLREVVDRVHLGGGQRDRRWVEPQVAVAMALHQGPGVAGVGLAVQHARGAGVGLLVVDDLLVGGQADHRRVALAARPLVVGVEVVGGKLGVGVEIGRAHV